MRYFVAVAEEGSFSRAAERLHISQPPLSQQIKNLERELDAQLFNRLPRGVSLTAAGASLLSSARSILAQVDTASQEATEIAAGMSGTRRVGTISSALGQVMPAVFDRVRRTIPGIRVELAEMSSREQTQAVLPDGLALGRVHAPCDTAALLSRPVFSEPLYAVLPKNHEVAHIQPLTVSHLSGDDFVYFPRHLASGLFDRMVSLCIGAGFSPKIRH